MTRHPLSCRIEAGTTICMRISNSFSEGEIQVLEFIVQTLLRGGTPTMATRSADFPSLCRKVQAMKKKVHEQKARPLGAGNSGASPDESSVGTVAAPAASAMAERDAQDARDAHDAHEVAEVEVSVGVDVGMARAG
jgi:hypothetical protein